MVAYGNPREIMRETGTDNLEAAFISIIDGKDGRRDETGTWSSSARK